jgi:hypothetical protein
MQPSGALNMKMIYVIGITFKTHIYKKNLFSEILYSVYADLISVSNQVIYIISNVVLV